MMRIFYIGLSGVGMMFSSMGLEMTLADFNLRRAALFATRYLCELRWHFPSVNKEISRRKAAENLQSLQGYDPSEFTFATVYFAMLKKNYVVMIVILVWW